MQLTLPTPMLEMMSNKVGGILKPLNYSMLHGPSSFNAQQRRDFIYLCSQQQARRRYESLKEFPAKLRSFTCDHLRITLD